MAKISVVLSQVIHEAGDEDFAVIDQATFSTIEKLTDSVFSVNIFIGLLETNMDYLIQFMMNLIVHEIKRVNKLTQNIELDFVILVPLNEAQIKHFGDRKTLLNTQHALESEIMSRTLIRDPIVKLHKEDDFARIISKEKLFYFRVFGKPDVTSKYPKNEIDELPKKPSLIYYIFNSA